MFSLSRFDRHATLMTRMADALGRDLETEMLSGRLAPEDYREKILRCVSCADADACAALLDASGDHLDAAPEFCRNRSAFEAGL